ncbi:MAG: putative membrane protein [Alphaproteobacteria bacterium]|jgi:uncharacterized membrane protein
MVAEQINKPTTVSSNGHVPVQKGRLHGLDFARGLACLSMPIFHTVYNLYVLGLIDTRWTRHIFWQTYQVLGLGTFVMVSGMAFTLSTRKTVNWSRLSRRALKLAAIALAITLVSYIVMPESFVRFGVLHFFATTILLAPILRPFRHWLVIPGLAIISLGLVVTKAGLYPESWLYITGLMSDRPRSIDYIPLVPWLGVFLLGMGLANFLSTNYKITPAKSWMKPVIWLGKHSLPFYLIHQIVVFGVLWIVAYFVL